MIGSRRTSRSVRPNVFPHRRGRVYYVQQRPARAEQAESWADDQAKS